MKKPYNSGIKTYVTLYPSGRIKMMAHTLNGKLHHYFKPALSIYRDDLNNTLFKEIFYYHGNLSKSQEGINKKYYFIYT